MTRKNKKQERYMTPISSSILVKIWKEYSIILITSAYFAIPSISRIADADMRTIYVLANSIDIAQVSVYCTVDDWTICKFKQTNKHKVRKLPAKSRFTYVFFLCCEFCNDIIITVRTGCVLRFIPSGKIETIGRLRLKLTHFLLRWN